MLGKHCSGSANIWLPQDLEEDSIYDPKYSTAIPFAAHLLPSKQDQEAALTTSIGPSTGLLSPSLENHSWDAIEGAVSNRVGLGT